MWAGSGTSAQTRPFMATKIWIYILTHFYTDAKNGTKIFTRNFHKKVRKPYYPAFHEKVRKRKPNGWIGGQVEGHPPVVLSHRPQLATRRNQPATTNPPHPPVLSSAINGA